MPQSDSRKRKLELIRILLRSDDGQLLLEEIEIMWDAYTLIGATPEKTAYNVGLRDAFKHIYSLSTGEPYE